MSLRIPLPRTGPALSFERFVELSKLGGDTEILKLAGFFPARSNENETGWAWSDVHQQALRWDREREVPF